MGQDRLDLTKGARIELIDILRDHAEYEIEGDGFKIIGEKASGQFELVLGRFELDDAKARITGYAEKRMQKSEEVEAMKKYGVHGEFKEIVNKALLDAVDSFVAQKNEKQAKVAQKAEPVAASEINEVLVAQEASVAPSK